MAKSLSTNLLLRRRLSLHCTVYCCYAISYQMFLKFNFYLILCIVVYNGTQIRNRVGIFFEYDKGPKSSLAASNVNIHSLWDNWH